MQNLIVTLTRKKGCFKLSRKNKSVELMGKSKCYWLNYKHNLDNKSFDQHFSANVKKHILQYHIDQQINKLLRSFVLIYNTWTSVWSAQHPNAVRNIQQITFKFG